MIKLNFLKKEVYLILKESWIRRRFNVLVVKHEVTWLKIVGTAKKKKLPKVKM